eukprot:gene4756-5103_t
MRNFWQIFLFGFLLLLVSSTENEEKSSHPSGTSMNLSLGISYAFIINYNLHPESLKNLTATLEALRIPYEVVRAIPFKHDFDRPKELLEPPPSHFFHNRTRMDLERVATLVKRRKEFTWEKVSEWQTQLQLFFRLANALRLAMLRNEQLQPFLVLDDEAIITKRAIEQLKPTFLNEELPQDWQLVVLDALHHTCRRQSIQINSKYCRVDAVLKLSGYVIRDMKALLSLINTFNTPFPRLFDYFVSRILSEDRLIGYSFVK